MASSRLSQPSSLAASSAWLTLRIWSARWNRPRADPCEVKATSLGKHVFACQIYTHSSTNALILQPAQPLLSAGGRKGEP